MTARKQPDPDFAGLNDSFGPSSPQSSSMARAMADPSTLTTQQLLREVMWLRELLESRLLGMDKAILLLQANADRSPTIAELYARHEQRFSDNDKAIELLQRSIDKSPTIPELYAKHEEKFHSISVQFAERDTRTEQTSKDSKVAVDAALQAAKEAVGEQNKSSALAIAKSEAATTKQIDQIGVIISTTNKGVDDKIDDIKSRITTIESRSKGMTDGWGILVGIAGMIIAAAAVVAAVAMHR